MMERIFLGPDKKKKKNSGKPSRLEFVRQFTGEQGTTSKKVS